YAGKSSEPPWLCSIARNLSMDECRKSTKFTELDEEQLEQPDNMVKSLENKDTALQIHLILHELDEPYKEVFQLRIFGELPFSQIGMIFGKTENWARVTYHRARLKIKERMDRNE
uniref:RNA polymerase sigma factor n=1 Tax=Ruminococcus bicirculans (ex Wegman et al. 2014) TaxID=1160721 RepID=UPI004024E978